MGILQFLNSRGDPEDRHHLVRMTDFFLHANHLCIAFELLSLNLYELIKLNQFRGLSISLVRVFLQQVRGSGLGTSGHIRRAVRQMQHTQPHSMQRCPSPWSESSFSRRGLWEGG